MFPFSNVLWPQEIAARAIVIVIWVLSGAALVLLARAWAALKRDRSDLNKLDKAISTSAVDAVGQLKEAPESRIGRRIVALERNPMKAREISQEYADWDQRELEAQIHFPKFIAGICVFIGLLGTIVGLATAIGTITIDSGTLSQEQLRDQLRSALEGMATGFSCTFHGVLAAILLGAFVSAYQSGVNRFTTDCEQFFARRIADSPALAGGMSPTEFTQLLHQAADHFRSVLIPFSESLESGGRTIREATSGLTEAVANIGSYQAALYRLAGTFEQHLPAFVQITGDSASRLGTASDRLAEVSERLERAGSGVAASSAQITGSIGQLAHDFRGFTEVVDLRMQEQRQEFERAIEGFRTAIASVRDNPFSQEVIALGARLDQNVQAINQEGMRVTVTIQQLGARFDAFSEALETSLRQNSQATAQQANDLQATLGALQGFVSLVEGSLQDAPVVREELHDLRREGEETLGALQHAAGSLHYAAESLRALVDQSRRVTDAPLPEPDVHNGDADVDVDMDVEPAWAGDPEGDAARRRAFPWGAKR